MNISANSSILVSLFKKDCIYLFLERGERREKERVRNINVWLPLTCPLPETRPAIQACALGIELATPWFTGQHSIPKPHQPGHHFDFLKIVL